MTMRLTTTRMGLAAVALGWLLGGCTGGPEPIAPPVQETGGLLGNGVFRWICVTSADPTCGTGAFPTWVALDAQFDLAFIPDADVPDDLSAFSLEPVSSARLTRDPVAFEGRLAGEVSVVALGGGYAIDYVSLTFAPVDDLMLGQPEGPDECDYDYDLDGVCDGTGTVVVDPPVALVLGDNLEVRARALGRGESLAGALDYAWESLTPEILTVTYTHGRTADLSVRGMGLARLSVRAGDYVKVFEYEVQEPPPEPGTGTEGESDGSGTETSSDDDFGTGTGDGSGSGTDGGSESSGSGTDGGSESSTGGETDGATTTGGVR
jgi:hypothetical protein